MLVKRSERCWLSPWLRAFWMGFQSCYSWAFKAFDFPSLLDDTYYAFD